MAMIQGGILASPEVGDKEMFFLNNSKIKTDKAITHNAPDPTYWSDGYILIPTSGGVTNIKFLIKNLKRIGMISSRDSAGQNAGSVEVSYNGTVDKSVSWTGTEGFTQNWLPYVNNNVNLQFAEVNLKIIPTGVLGVALEGFYMNEDAVILDANITYSTFIKTGTDLKTLQDGEFVTVSPQTEADWKVQGIENLNVLLTSISNIDRPMTAGTTVGTGKLNSVSIRKAGRNITGMGVK